MTNMKQFFLIILILLLIGCPDNKYDYDIIITDFAVNLDELNSEYDDYNMDLPYPAQRMDIYFSSNRNSLGHDFDIVAGKMDFSFHSEDEILNVSYVMIAEKNTNYIRFLFKDFTKKFSEKFEEGLREKIVITDFENAEEIIEGIFPI